MRLRLLILAQLASVAFYAALARDVFVIPLGFEHLYNSLFLLLVLGINFLPILVYRAARSEHLPEWKAWSVFLVEIAIAFLYFVALLPGVQ